MGGWAGGWVGGRAGGRVGGWACLLWWQPHTPTMCPARDPGTLLTRHAAVSMPSPAAPFPACRPRCRAGCCSPGRQGPPRQLPGPGLLWRRRGGGAAGNGWVLLTHPDWMPGCLVGVGLPTLCCLRLLRLPIHNAQPCAPNPTYHPAPSLSPLPAYLQPPPAWPLPNPTSCTRCPPCWQTAPPWPPPAAPPAGCWRRPPRRAPVRPCSCCTAARWLSSRWVGGWPGGRLWLGGV